MLAIICKPEEKVKIFSLIMINDNECLGLHSANSLCRLTFQIDNLFTKQI